MARALSQVYTQIRGSVGGVTYLANQFHQIVCRQRTSPVNPNTTYQAQMRTAFAAASVDWLNVSASVRAGWEDYALTLIYQGPLGPYTLPARQVFIGNIGTIRYLANRGLIVGVQSFSPPTTPGFAAMEIIDITYPINPTIGVVVDVYNPNVPDRLFVYAERSIAFEVTRNRFKGPFRSVTLLGTSIDTADGGSVEFSPLAIGKYYFIRLRGVTIDAPHRLTTLQIVRGDADTLPI